VLAVRISRGVVNLLAKAILLLTTTLACTLIGFLLPMTPVVRTFIGSAFWAGLLATAGAIAGMYFSDIILTRLERRESGAPSVLPSEPSKETRRPV
jgi:hypothetical protein